MLDNTSRWSHARGSTVVPSWWQATGLFEDGSDEAVDRLDALLGTPSAVLGEVEPLPRTELL